MLFYGAATIVDYLVVTVVMMILHPGNGFGVFTVSCVTRTIAAELPQPQSFVWQKLV